MSDLIFRELEELLQGTHPYIERYRQELDAVQENLWMNLEAVPQLREVEQRFVLSYFLELACQAQNTLNIELGRASLVALPRNWLLEKIEAASKPLLDTNDDWEYRRLLEVYWKLDEGLVRNLVIWGEKSTNPEVQETAKENLLRLA